MNLISKTWAVFRRVLGVFAPDRLAWKALPRPILLMFCFGWATRCGFPPVESSFLGYAGIVFFIWYFGKNRRYLTNGTGWWLGFFYGFGFFYTASFWLNSLTRFNIFVPVGILALGVILALWMGVIGVGMAWVARRSPSMLPLFAAAAWTLAEAGRGYGVLAYPFYRIAHFYWETPGGAAVWGELGYTFATVLFCGGVAFLMLRWWNFPGYISRRNGIAWIAQMALGGLVLIAPSFATQPRDSTETARRRLLLMQPNIIQDRKMEVNTMSWGSDVRERTALAIMNETMAVCEEATTGTAPGSFDLAVFPEATFPGVMLQFHATVVNRVLDLARGLQCPVIVGAEIVERPNSTNEKWYNGTWLFGKDDNLLAQYRKRQLVPFGEHVPYLNVIPGFQDLLGIGTFDEGEGAQLLPVERGFDVGVLLCFESAMQSVSRENALAGAELQTITTNDSWYDYTSGLHFHMVHAAFRAAETGIPVVQAANSGVTIAFDRYGKAVASIEPYRSGALAVDLDIPVGIGPKTPQTWFAAHGNKWLLALILMVIGILASTALKPYPREQ